MVWSRPTTTYDKKPGKPPALVHRLRPGYRSPSNIDADGLKRADGLPIDGHVDWIKFTNPFTAVVSGFGDDLNVKCPGQTYVDDKEFGPYDVDNTALWGEPAQIVTHAIKHRKKTTGYVVNWTERLSKAEALREFKKGHLINVTLVRKKEGPYLRTLPDREKSNNLMTSK